MPETKMTDHELRRKLIEMGMDVGPITDSTRKLYEKKLSELQKNRRRSAPLQQQQQQSHKSQSPQSTLIGFSSEESDLDLKGESESRRRRRRTLPPTPSNFPVVSAKDLLPDSPRPQEFKVPLPKVSKGSSDSLVGSVSKRSTLRSSKRLSLNHTSYELDTSDSDFDLDNRLSDLKKRRSFGNSSNSQQSKDNSLDFSFSPPPSVNLKSRPKSGQTSPAGIFSPGLGKSSFQLQANGQRKQAKDDDHGLEWGFSGEEESTSGLQHVPHLLLALVAFFFVIVGLLYVGVRQNDYHTSSLSANSFSDLLCKGFVEEDCVPKENLDLSLMATRQLHGFLAEIAGFSECDPESYLKKSVTFRQAKDFLSSNLKELENEVVLNRVFESCIFLIKRNPNWGLIVLEDHLGEGYALESQVARKSLFCRMRQAFQKAFKQLCLALAVILGIYGCFVYFNHRRQKKRIFETQLFELTEKIIDILQHNQEKAGYDKDSYLPVVHVRDMLIPLAERNNKGKQKLWDAAVSFLESNESRIRSEHQRVAGEDYLVWRWLQPSSPYSSSPSSSSTLPDSDTRSKKVWQGQAFGTSGKGGNVLPFCPTPCLKIRNMFDPEVEFGTDWPQYIRDALLEKCENSNGILHIHVDTTSKEGCVYVKCSTQELAGQAYRALHGWWFDGNLITVKYLRLERYHERFPDARNCTTSLKPSNNLKLSLSSHQKT